MFIQSSASSRSRMSSNSDSDHASFGGGCSSTPVKTEPPTSTRRILLYSLRLPPVPQWTTCCSVGCCAALADSCQGNCRSGAARGHAAGAAAPSAPPIFEVCRLSLPNVGSCGRCCPHRRCRSTGSRPGHYYHLSCR